MRNQEREMRWTDVEKVTKEGRERIKGIKQEPNKGGSKSKQRKQESREGKNNK